jgi:large subunit ribosomal protein L10
MGEKTQKIQPYKVEAINQIKTMIQGSKDYIFTDYRGLNVDQIGALRRELREQQAAFKVIKNNYARIALSELAVDIEDDFLIDPTALALIAEDSGPVAKVLVKYRKNTTLRIKGGVIEGQVMKAEAIEEISNLPSKDQLYAMLMSTMIAPVRNFMYAANGVVSKLVRTLQAVADSKEEN